MKRSSSCVHENSWGTKTNSNPETKTPPKLFLQGTGIQFYIIIVFNYDICIEMKTDRQSLWANLNSTPL